jgi:tetratricopeptide (TPR) repeat protein
MRATATLVALCLILTTPAAAATWTEVRTPHFLLIGDARASDMRRVATRFEQFYAVMQGMLSRQAVSSAVPTVILVFANERSFRPYMPMYEGKRVDVGGLFWSGRDLNYVAVNAEHGEFSYPTIFHELTHLITANVLRQPPLWFVEGIAEYYSTFDMRSPTEVFLGRPIAHHTALLRDQFLPFRELLAADDTARLYNEGNRRTIFYAQSWALVHYLRGNPETRPRFDDFLRLVALGTPQEQALREAFGVDGQALEKSLRNYVQQFRVPRERWTLGTPVDESSLETAVIQEPAALVHLGRVLMRMGRLSEAEQRFTAALTAHPQLPIAHASLAHLHVRQERAADAWTRLSQAPHGSGFLDHYLSAVAADAYLDAVGEESELARKAAPAVREHAAAALRAREDVAEAWRIMARSALVSGDVSQAEVAVGRALALAPAYEPYRFLLASVLARQREFAKARNVLGELIAHGRTSDVRTAARQFMVALVRHERQFAPGEQADADVDVVPTHDPREPSSTGEPTLTPVFRRVGPGETRVFGALTAVACDARGVTLVVQMEGRTVRVVAPAFDHIEFVTYRDDLEGEVRCAPRTAPEPVYVTWPGPPPGADSISVPKVTVEFTPRDFRPKPGGPGPAS